jgi:hypothetical protein
MRRTLSLSPIVAIVALLTIMLPVHAANSVGICTGGSGVKTIPVPGIGTYYVDDRGADNGVWVYEETNEKANLQRGGTNVMGEHDTCTDDPNGTPDTLIL